MRRYDPVREILESRMLEPGCFHATSKLILFGEKPNTFDEVLVRVPVTSDQLTDAGDSIEGVEIVERFHGLGIYGAELEAEEPSSWAENAVGFRKGSINVRDVPQAERDGVHIERLTVKRQGLCVGHLERHSPQCVWAEPLLSAVLPDPQHALVDVRNHHLSCRPFLAVKTQRRDMQPSLRGKAAETKNDSKDAR